MKKLYFILPLILLVLLSTGAAAENRRMNHLAGHASLLVAVQWDGTVKAIGDNTYGQCETSAWRDVVEVAVGSDHTLGLKADGTVYAAGDNSEGQCNVQDWKDIVMIAAGIFQSIGLKSDGTVVYAGDKPYVDESQMDDWRDIVWIGADWSFCGIDKNGKVIGTFEFDVSGFHDAVQVYEDANMTYVLSRDGRVQITSEFYDGYETVNEISAEYYSGICELGSCGPYFAALRRDGTVDCDASAPYIADWTDIVEIEADFGVKSDGSMIYEEDWVDNFTSEQLEEIKTWKVKVDPETVPTAAQTAVP